MSKLLSSLILGCLALTACKKDASYWAPPVSATKTTCIPSTSNPAGKVYNQDSVVNFICTQSFCGLIPLNNRNYWIYEDSIFVGGVFDRVELDTLMFSSMTSVQDGLVWWKPSMSVGLPATMYSNDSSLFVLTQRLFTPGYLDVKKELGLFAGDSIGFLTSFEDYAAIGKGVKLRSAYETEGGRFNGVVMFEKRAPNMRRDQIFIQPGLGVVRYTCEKAEGFPRVMRMQKISTLIAYHTE